jgi:hypothetical protein
MICGDHPHRLSKMARILSIRRLCGLDERLLHGACAPDIKGGRSEPAKASVAGRLDSRGTPGEEYAGGKRERFICVRPGCTASVSGLRISSHTTGEPGESFADRSVWPRVEWHGSLGTLSGSEESTTSGSCATIQMPKPTSRVLERVRRRAATN